MPSRFCVAFLTVISFRMAFFRQFSGQKCELFLLSGAEGPEVIEIVLQSLVMGAGASM